MTAPIHRSIELLEPRIAPANLVITNGGKTALWTDVDGDLVTLTTNKAIFTESEFHFLDQKPGDIGFQLAQLDLRNIFTDGVSLVFSARRDSAAKVGDGCVNVGWILATNDLTTVTVPGDLARLNAGNGDEATPGLVSLTVHSASEFGIGTQVGAPGEKVNGNDPTTDWVVRGRLGTLTVKGDFFANLQVGGSVLPAAAGIGSATIWGDIVATDHTFTDRSDGSTGYIEATGPIGSVRVLGNVNGGLEKLSGSIHSSSSIASVWIGGNLSGGRGDLSGTVVALGPIGSVYIGGTLFGGGTRDEGGQTIPSDRAGSVSSATHLGKVTVVGDVVGGTSFFGGSIFTLPGSGGKIDSVTIGGRLVGATKSVDLGQGQGPQLLFNGIYSDGALGPVKVGAIQGASSAEAVSIVARGVINPKTPTEALAIASITVARSVASANILAGYNAAYNAVNPDVQIGAVKVGSNWIGGNLIAGVIPGASHVFGANDDAVISPGATVTTPAGPVTVTDNLTIPAKIASLTVAGYMAGSTPTTDSYGIEAQMIGAVKIGLTALPMQPNSPFTPPDDFLIGVTHDVRIREV